MTIHKALLKYGGASSSNFELHVLEYTSSSAAADSDSLFEREQYYIDLLKPSYNMLKKAGSWLGSKHTEVSLLKMKESRKGWVHSEETKTKISNALSGSNNPQYGKPHLEETKLKISLANRGENHRLFNKFHSEETKAKISKANLGRIHSDEVKSKISNSHLGKSHSEETKLKISTTLGSPVEVLDTSTNVKTKYFTVKQAADTLSCSVITVRKYIKSGELYKKIYRIQKAHFTQVHFAQKESYVKNILLFNGTNNILLFIGTNVAKNKKNEKGSRIINLEILLPARVALLMVKVILLEVYLIDAYIIGLNLTRNMVSTIEFVLDNWVRAKGLCSRGINYVLNLGKGLPKSRFSGIVNWEFGIAYSFLKPWLRNNRSTNINYPTIFGGIIRFHQRLNGLQGLELSNSIRALLPRISGNIKIFGRVIGRYASTVVKTADSVSVFKYNSLSKIDKLFIYCKNLNLFNNNFSGAPLNWKIYNLLYSKNIYMQAYEMLKNEALRSASPYMIYLANNEIVLQSKSKINYLLLHPNLFKLSQGCGVIAIILEIIYSLKTGSYKFIAFNNPNSEGATKCMSGMNMQAQNSTSIFNSKVYLRDIILIRAIVIILEAIYKSSLYSRLFKPSFSHKSALESIQFNFKDATWYIKGDLSKCIDSVHLKLLMSKLENKIKDKRFTDFTRKAWVHFSYFTCGADRQKKTNGGHVISSSFARNNNTKSVLYSILINIFLDSLDLYMEKLVSLYKTNNKDVIIFYVRYEDTWMVGVKGSYQDCVNISNYIKNYLSKELLIKLFDDSVEIINVKLAKYVIFLGVRICVDKSSRLFDKITNSPAATSKTYSFGSRASLQSLNKGNIRLEAPIKYITKILTSLEFLKDSKPIPRLIWTSCDKSVILAMYSSYYYSIMDYYSFVKNKSQLDSWLKQVLNSSCLKLLASKFTLSSQKNALRKFGVSDNPSFLQSTKKRAARGSAPNILSKSRLCINNSKLNTFGTTIKRFSSSLANINNKFNLLAFISGFIDAEGNFYIKVVKSSANKTGYSIQLTFNLNLH